MAILAYLGQQGESSGVTQLVRGRGTWFREGEGGVGTRGTVWEGLGGRWGWKAEAEGVVLTGNIHHTPVQYRMRAPLPVPWASRDEWNE